MLLNTSYCKSKEMKEIKSWYSDLIFILWSEIQIFPYNNPLMCIKKNQKKTGLDVPVLSEGTVCTCYLCSWHKLFGVLGEILFCEFAQCVLLLHHSFRVPGSILSSCYYGVSHILFHVCFYTWCSVRVWHPIYSAFMPSVTSINFRSTMVEWLLKTEWIKTSSNL